MRIGLAKLSCVGLTTILFVVLCITDKMTVYKYNNV
jgi:hypothetical protein